MEEFAHEQGLTVTGVNPDARSVKLLGTVGQLNTAFGVDLGEYTMATGTYRGREGEVQVPAPLADRVLAVLGLDDRPAARPHFRVLDDLTAAPATSYPPQEVARRYGFPTDFDGTGQTVAIIELGGGYQLADLRTYFTDQGLRTPRITSVSVDGAHNTPGQDADGEVCLDIEVIGAVAQGARLAVYFGPNTFRGFFDVIAAAVHDRRRKPSVISISWGAPEVAWSPGQMDVFDALFADAAALGITVYCASGDDGSDDRVGDGQKHVDFPAAAPHAVGCGGTTLTDADEVVWNETASGHGAGGGGVSRHFGLPAYQNASSVPLNPQGNPGRGVPDVAGDADPLTGYQVRVNGQNMVIGGTSAVSPLWSALTAIANQRNGHRAGAPHAALYDQSAAGAFRNIVAGNNGGYQAGPGWDACTGLGTPHGDKVVAIL